MKTISSSEFKRYALHVLELVAKTKESVLVTKNGKPVAEIVPSRETVELPVLGRLADTLVFENDIVSPLGRSVWGTLK